MSGGKLLDPEMPDQPIGQIRFDRAAETDPVRDIGVGRPWPGENREGGDGRRRQGRRPLQRAAAQRAAGLTFLDEIEDARRDGDAQGIVGMVEKTLPRI